ncbi:Uroporphyrinogen-III C-methyltransferase [Stieleria bergensis]|uniref:uroporphyrinogen-III C-methyltransferase n=1 Tax=Stieleria bergensis TaxID=2528025 RepID=A0A517SN30_9BACT|nr:Uroporphyrinogen-III C-methyltransferase [Planctomycetes bacterium SV_7m_r]
MLPSVYLIGAGPGDPELITLRGARCLRQADVVLYDGLSNQQLLALAPQATGICVGKHGQSRIWTQEEIIAEMLQHVRAGRSVARLKGGDPAVFARTAEEVDALNEAGISYEIVPGITAALAAGSYAGIPITHRKVASAVALITGHEEPGKTQSALDWQALANFPGTLVVYMGVTTAKVWTDALISAGKDPLTPCALVRRCSHPDQETIHCTLEEIAACLTPASKFRPPVITIIGPVTSLADTMKWVDQRALHGQRIMVTRPAEQADATCQAIIALGGQPIRQPLIEVAPVDDPEDLDFAIDSLQSDAVIVFCSRNGVTAFFDRLFSLDLDARSLHGNRIAAIGRKTAEQLEQYGIVADLVPDDFSSTGLCDLLEEQFADHQESLPPILSIRASRGTDTLQQRLTAQGFEVQQLVAYQNRDVETIDASLHDMMRHHQIDWVTVTSSATANNLVRHFGDALNNTKLVAISATTAKTLADLGYPAAAIAEDSTVDTMIQAIVSAPLNSLERASS